MHLAFRKRLVDIVTPLADSAWMINPMGIYTADAVKYESDTGFLTMLENIDRYYKGHPVGLINDVRACFRDFREKKVFFFF